MRLKRNIFGLGLGLGLFFMMSLGILSANESNASWKTITQFEVKHTYNLVGFLNDSYGITVGYGGECHYTNDGGKTWPRAENKSFCRFGLEILDETHAWHSGNAGQVGASNDGGKTWHLVDGFGGGEPEHCRYISFNNAQTGWIASDKVLGSTTDGGQNWSNVKLPEKLTQISAIAGLSNEAVYLLDTNKPGGVLFYTNDSGQHWSSLPLGLKEQCYPVSPTQFPAAMRFFDKEHGMIIANCKGYQLWELDTNDGGKTWRRNVIPGPRPTGSLFLAPDGKTLTITGINQIITVLGKKD
jgi:photosystem II stability/assembly factor-like uncharacterized protein